MSGTQNLSLYEPEILLWSEDMVAKLKVHDFGHLEHLEHLDIENLIETLEALGIVQRKGATAYKSCLPH